MTKTTKTFEGTKQFEKIAQDATDFSREGFEAFTRALSVMAKGTEETMKIMTSMVQETAKKQAEIMKTAMASKTINEWADAQNKMAQVSFDDFMSGATKMTEISVRTMTETVEPINEQMTKVIKKTTDIAA